MECSMANIEQVYEIVDQCQYWIKEDNADSWLTVKGMLKNPATHVLMPEAGTILIFWPLNSITYEVHIASTNTQSLHENCKKSFRWMGDNTLCEVLVANIPEPYRATRILALQQNMERVGVLERAFLIHGVRENIVIFKGDLQNMIGE